MRFRIDWASLLVGRKFIVFALFFFVFEGNFQVQAPPPRGGGRFKERFFALRVWGLIHGRAYFRTWLVRDRKEFWVIESQCERRSVEPPNPTSEILQLLLCLRDKTRPNCPQNGQRDDFTREPPCQLRSMFGGSVSSKPPLALTSIPA